MKSISIITETGDRYEFVAGPFVGRHLLAVNSALAHRPELSDRNAQPTVEMAGYCRALEIVKACCDRFTGPQGDVAACEENLIDIAPSIVMQAALQMRGVRASIDGGESNPTRK